MRSLYHFFRCYVPADDTAVLNGHVSFLTRSQLMMNVRVPLLGVLTRGNWVPVLKRHFGAKELYYVT
jgi:hypothetical protein